MPTGRKLCFGARVSAAPQGTQEGEPGPAPQVRWVGTWSDLAAGGRLSPLSRVTDRTPIVQATGQVPTANLVRSGGWCFKRLVCMAAYVAALGRETSDPRPQGAMRQGCHFPCRCLGVDREIRTGSLGSGQCTKLRPGAPTAPGLRG